VGPLLAAALLSLSAVPAAAEASITWRGKRLKLAQLPGELEGATARAIALWEPWAAKQGYKIDVDDAARLVILTPRTSSRANKARSLSAKCEEWFEALLPPPPRAAAAPATGGIPEDPEAPRSKPLPPPRDTTVETGIAAPDTQTPVLLVLAKEKDQVSAAAFLGSLRADLAAWARSAPEKLGFVVEVPLCAAYVEDAAGQEEWDADHELVSRVARLLTLARFSQMPYWLACGLAFEAEMTLDGSIWSYPYRDEFVYTVEHAAWPGDLAREFEGRAGKPLGIDEVARWRRGVWDGDAARKAWGLTRYLAQAHAKSMHLVLEDLRRHRDEHGRVTQDDGTWRRSPDYEVPAEEQLAILKRRCGEKVLEEASAWFPKAAAKAK